MKPFLFLLLLFATGGALCAQTVTTIDDFDWLNGHWQMDAGKLQVHESWTKGADNAYHGKGYVLKGKDTIVRETIKIEKVGNHWVYIAQVNNNNPVLFTITPASTPQSLVFENTEHDNPQRVIYKQVSESEIFARTEAIVNGVLEADDYNYKRR